MKVLIDLMGQYSLLFEISGIGLYGTASTTGRGACIGTGTGA